MSKPMARDKAPETHVSAQIAAAIPETSILEAETPPAAETPKVEERAAPDLNDLVKSLLARIDSLEGRTNESYADDDKLFIAKPGAEQWSERRLNVQTKSYEEVQMSATAFYGPFLSETAIAAYVGAKQGKRPNDHYEWEGVRTVTGREKRTIEAQERQSREAAGLSPRLPAYFG